MKGLSWRMALLLSHSLEPEEREAAMGDLAQDGANHNPLHDIFGLVIRRQAVLWRHWRPWAVLVGVAIPFALWISLLSRFTADHSAITLWLYANNWDWNLFGIEAFRHDMAVFLGAIPLELLHLACWAWSLGLLLGWVSRKTLFSTATLFCLVLLCGLPLAMTFRSFLQQSFVQHRPGVYSSNAPVFQVEFYRVIYPVIVKLLLVLPASIAGMWQVRRMAAFRPVVRKTVLIASFTPVLFNCATGLTLGLVDPHSKGLILGSSILRAMDIAVYWPVIYWLTTTIQHRRRLRAA